MNSNRVKKYLYITIGSFFVLLGIIGAFLPIMPTTIFLIIATYFYARSSERLYHALIYNKYFGKLIRDYMENKSMPLRSKILALTMLNGFISYAIIFAANHYVLQLLLFHIALFVSLFILSLRTSDTNAKDKIKQIVVE